MKILRIVYDWPKPWSGLGPHPYELTKAQVKLGHEVELFVGLWPRSGPEEIEGVKINPIIREPVKGSIIFTSALILFFKYLKWRKNNTPDIIHIHGHFGFWIYLYRTILKRFQPWSEELKVPLVSHYHKVAKGRWEKMVEDGKYIMPHSRFIQWPLEVLCDKMSFKVSAACVFVSEENLEGAKKYYEIDPSRCFVVESGVNPELFRPIPPEEREKSRGDLGLDQLDRVVLNHGMMVERKNIHLLVEAMSYLPKTYKLLLVGSGDDSYHQRISEIITKHGLEERILRVGYTPYPQVPIAFQISDIFVLPSGWEGLPKVVMQGLATGVPCLVSGFKLSEEVSGLEYLKDLDPKTIAAQILDIDQRRPEVDVQKVLHYYSWGRRASEIEKIYEYAKDHYL